MQDALDRNVLEELLSFASDGDPDLLLDLIQMFLEDSPSKVAAVREGLEAGDFEKAERAAHREERRLKVERERVVSHDRGPAAADWPRPEKGKKPAHFARDKRWKLYSDGRLIDVKNDVMEKSPASDRDQIRATLQAVLDRMPAEGQTLLKFD